LRRDSQLALKEAVQGPDFARAQTLKTNTHATRLAGATGFNPAHFAGDLDGLGLGWDLETDLQPSLEWKGLFGFHEETTQGNVYRGGGTLLVACDDLDV
jgi:hypothetical protein